MVAVQPPRLLVITCPNGHDVIVPEKPGFAFINGVGVMQRSIEDLIQDCPVCGPFRRHLNGTVELHITSGSPLSTRPIEWCVTELTTGLHQAVPSESERAEMAENGALRSALERLRSKYEARGVDFDAVMDSVVEAEELVPNR